METVLVTVSGPLRRVDLEMPGDVPISELIPTLLQVCGPHGMLAAPLNDASAWGLGSQTGGPFPQTRSLIECGVVDGALLVFQDALSWQEQQARPAGRAVVVPPAVQTPGGMGIRWNREGLLPDK